MKCWRAVVIALLLPAMAQAVEVVEPWVAAQQGEIYLTLKNEGSEQERLTGANSSNAASVQLIAVVQLGSVQSVQPLKSLGIPAGGQQQLRPGHTHLRLVGLKQPLQVGHTLPLTLQFEKAGQRRVEVEIRP